MSRRLQILREELEDFRVGYREERRNYPSGWVPGRVIRVTGLMLYELEKNGMIESNGRGEYRER